jgi:arginine repressor
MAIDREDQDRRRRALLALLAERPMSRQVDIEQELRRRGFKVMQSSVSRDLEALGIERKDKLYRPPPPPGDDELIGKMEPFIHQVRSAGPYLLILDTAPGTAKAVALRTAAWPEIKGVAPRTTPCSSPPAVRSIPAFCCRSSSGRSRSKAEPARWELPWRNGSFREPMEASVEDWKLPWRIGSFRETLGASVADWELP